MDSGERKILPLRPRDATKAKYPLTLTAPRLVEQGFHWLMVWMSLLLGT